MLPECKMGSGQISLTNHERTSSYTENNRFKNSVRPWSSVRFLGTFSYFNWDCNCGSLRNWSNHSMCRKITVACRHDLLFLTIVSVLSRSMWSYIIMASSNGSIFPVISPLWGNPPVTGAVPSQSPVTTSFDVLFALRRNKWINTQSRRRWFATLFRRSWRHCHDYSMSIQWPCIIAPQPDKYPWTYGQLIRYQTITKTPNRVCFIVGTICDESNPLWPCNIT